MKVKQIYKNLLKLYPKEYRDKFASEQEIVFEDLLREKNPGFKFFLFIFKDMILSLIKEHTVVWNKYLIYNGNKKRLFFSMILIGISILVIGCLSITQYVLKNIILLNKLTHPIVILTVLFVLPGLSIIVLSSAIFISIKRSWNKEVINDFIYNNLPVVVTLLFSTIIFSCYILLFFFHDSIHCLSPIHISTGFKSVKGCFVKAG